jgi:hypothetical protein
LYTRPALLDKPRHWLHRGLKPPHVRVDYEGFTVWLNCQEHAVAKFSYNAQRDSGSFPRSSTFCLDPAVPYACQPSSTGFREQWNVKPG